MSKIFSDAFSITSRFFSFIDERIWKYRIFMYLLVFGAGTLTAIGIGYLDLVEVNFRLHHLLGMNVWYIYGFNFFVCLTIEVFFRILRRFNDQNIQNIIKAMFLCLYFGIIFNFINDLYYVIQAVV